MKNKGFTLIEILITVAIFSITIGAMSGIFSSVLRNQRRGLSNQELVNSASYNLEYISRILRMARKQTAALPSCLSQNGLNYEVNGAKDSIKFLNYQGDCYRIYLQGTSIYQKKNTETELPITPANLKISFLKFNLSGQSDTDNLQPRVTIAFVIENITPKTEEKTGLRVQTSISQRELDTK